MVIANVTIAASGTLFLTDGLMESTSSDEGGEYEMKTRPSFMLPK